MDPVYLDRAALERVRGRPFDGAAQGVWCAGEIAGLARPCVAMVGTRAASGLGKRLAREIAGALGRAGCCIVSGLALGIDGCAHRGALDAGAPTVAVLGGGHRLLFPPRHRGLAEEICRAGGAVLSPFPPDEPPRPGQFLARNGIVAALADAVLVVEAPRRSGALNTAGWAAGRIPVLAIPGDVDRPQVQGCLALLRDGATLARGAGDVLEALGLALPAPESAGALNAATAGGPVLAAIRGGARTLDALVGVTGLSAAAVFAALTQLQLDGAVEAGDGGTYAPLR